MNTAGTQRVTNARKMLTPAAALLVLSGMALLNAPTAKAATPPHAPTGLTATLVGQTIVLHFSASPGATYYRLERSVKANNGSYTFAFGQFARSNTTTYTDANVLPGATYTYRVRAFKSGAGSSAYSNTASVNFPR